MFLQPNSYPIRKVDEARLPSCILATKRPFDFRVGKEEVFGREDLKGYFASLTWRGRIRSQ